MRCLNVLGQVREFPPGTAAEADARFQADQPEVGRDFESGRDAAWQRHQQRMSDRSLWGYPQGSRQWRDAERASLEKYGKDLDNLKYMREQNLKDLEAERQRQKADIKAKAVSKLPPVETPGKEYSRIPSVPLAPVMTPSGFMREVASRPPVATPGRPVSPQSPPQTPSRIPVQTPPAVPAAFSPTPTPSSAPSRGQNGKDELKDLADKLSEGQKKVEDDFRKEKDAAYDDYYKNRPMVRDQYGNLYRQTMLIGPNAEKYLAKLREIDAKEKAAKASLQESYTASLNKLLRIPVKTPGSPSRGITPSNLVREFPQAPIRPSVMTPGSIPRPPASAPTAPSRVPLQTLPETPAALPPTPTESTGPSGQQSYGGEGQCVPPDVWIPNIGCVNALSFAPTPTQGGGGGGYPSQPSEQTAPDYSSGAYTPFAPTPTLGQRFPVVNLMGTGLYDDGVALPYRRGRAVYPFDPAGFGGPQIPILGQRI